MKDRVISTHPRYLHCTPLNPGSHFNDHSLKGLGRKRDDNDDWRKVHHRPDSRTQYLTPCFYCVSSRELTTPYPYLIIVLYLEITKFGDSNSNKQSRRMDRRGLSMWISSIEPIFHEQPKLRYRQNSSSVTVRLQTHGNPRVFVPVQISTSKPVVDVFTSSCTFLSLSLNQTPETLTPKNGSTRKTGCPNIS